MRYLLKWWIAKLATEQIRFLKKLRLFFIFVLFVTNTTSNNTSAITANTTITNNNHCTKNEGFH